jgi:hypothetical protein
MDVQFQLLTGRPLVSRVPPLHYDGHRSLAHRPQDFTSPDRETIQHALAIASSCRVSQPAAPAGKSAPRWIDRIIGTARSPSLCDNDFNSALQPLFHNRDARYPCVGRPRRDEQLHAGFRGLLHMETNERARHFTERVAKRRTGVAPSIHGNGHSRQLYAGLHPG